MPNPNIFKAFGQRITGLYGSRQQRKMKVSPILNPINHFKTHKKGLKKEGSKHSTLKSIGMMVRTRIVSGPELNVLLLGIPFLIDFGISYGTGAFDPVKRQKKKNKKRNHVQINFPVDEESVEMSMSDESDSESLSESESSNSEDLGSEPPLPQAPFSDQALKLMKRLIAAGMSKKGARKIVSGELEGQDLSDHLSEEDCEVFHNLIGTVFLPDEDSE